MANRFWEAAVHPLVYLKVHWLEADCCSISSSKPIWGISAMERRWATVAARFAATVQSADLGKLNLRRIDLGFAGNDGCPAGLGMEAAGFGGEERCRSACWFG
ncbi:hypothetical protein ACLOJK_034709 [Asimina triloba]